MKSLGIATNIFRNLVYDKSEVSNWWEYKESGDNG